VCVFPCAYVWDLIDEDISRAIRLERYASERSRVRNEPVKRGMKGQRDLYRLESFEHFSTVPLLPLLCQVEDHDPAILDFEHGARYVSG
jgi:hypothetical protein